MAGTFIVRERNPGINAGSVEWDLRALIDRYDQKDIGVIMDPVNIKVCQKLDAASILKVLAACPEVKGKYVLRSFGEAKVAGMTPIGSIDEVKDEHDCPTMVHKGRIPVIDVLHPRPNPIVAAMYTLRDLDANVILLHGPAGCGFMPSRRLEEAGVRVVTTGMTEQDLIFGSQEKLIRILRQIESEFHPKLVGVVGTCASMIIGENLEAAVDKAAIKATVLPIDIHGCSGANTTGAIRVLEVAAERRVISYEERDRQKALLDRATHIEMELVVLHPAHILSLQPV